MWAEGETADLRRHRADGLLRRRASSGRPAERLHHDVDIEMPCSSRGDAVTVRNIGPAVVLVHGVGVGPESFAETASALTATGRRVHRVVRRGYGPGRLALNPDMKVLSLDAQVDLIIEDVMQREEQPTVWVGVSGGATLGVDRRVPSAGGDPRCRAARTSHRNEGCRLARRGTGGSRSTRGRSARPGRSSSRVPPSSSPGWSAPRVGKRSESSAGRWSSSARTLVGAEVPNFATFEADRAADDLDVPVVITVGERSPAPRHEAAERAAELLGGTCRGDGRHRSPPPDRSARRVRRSDRKLRVTVDPDCSGTVTGNPSVRGLVADTTPYPWPYDAALSRPRIALIVLGWNDEWWAHCHEPGRRGRGRSSVSPPRSTTVITVDQLARRPSTDRPTRRRPMDRAPTSPARDRRRRPASTDSSAGRSTRFCARQRCDLLLLVGLGLEATVHSTMRSANDRGYECLLVVDACAPLDPDLVAAGDLDGRDVRRHLRRRRHDRTRPGRARRATPDPIPDFSERPENTDDHPTTAQRDTERPNTTIEVVFAAIEADPYTWPYDGVIDPSRTALINIDWQTDFCGPGGYVDAMGYDLNLTRAGLEPTARVLAAARAVGHDGHPHPRGPRTRPVRPAAEQAVAFSSASAPASATPDRAAASWCAERPAGRSCPRWPRSPASRSSTSRARARSTRRSSTWCCAPPASPTSSSPGSRPTCACTRRCARRTTAGYECLLLSDCTGATDPGNYEAALKMVTMQGGVFGAVAIVGRAARVLERVSDDRRARARPAASPSPGCVDAYRSGDLVAVGGRSRRRSSGSPRTAIAAVWIGDIDADAIRDRAATAPDRAARSAVYRSRSRTTSTSAGMPTTAACPAFSYVAADVGDGRRPTDGAGGVVIGKTNLDQFATGLVGTRSPYGIPTNPFDPPIVPGGSSSGSGVAVAAGLVPFALGTDTAGSGRIPAALGNIVGCKPTLGLVSTRRRRPGVPIARLCVGLRADRDATRPSCSACSITPDADDIYSRPSGGAPATRRGCRDRRS